MEISSQALSFHNLNGYASGFDVQAFDAVTGTPRWPAPAPAVAAGSCDFAATIAYSVFAITNGMIFVKSNNTCDVAKVYALSTTDGSLLWDSGALGDNGAIGGVDTSTPSVAEGRLYFAVGNILYVFSGQPSLVIHRFRSLSPRYLREFMML